MGMTLRQYMDDRLRWIMFEKGLQVEWNYLNQIINSLAGSGVTGGTTDLGTVDITAATGLNKSTTKTFSGTFASGAQAGGSGFLVPPGDTAGNVGPNPQRL
jgi:hypothetical protein